MSDTAETAMRLYHNPACSKSRGALELLRERGAEFEIVEYLKAPLEREALGEVLDALGGDPGDLVRKDKRFRELGLDAARYGEGATREDVIALLLEHPALMSRPIALRDGRAVVGRPPERVLELLS